MQPTTYLNKLDVLQSAYNKYVNLFGDEVYFVTIQPTEPIYTSAQAQAYINKLFPEQPPYILLLENNYSYNQHNGYKDYNMEPELHIHLYVVGKYIKHLPNITFYTNTKHLCKIKVKTRCFNLHITARKIESQYVHEYLSKQMNNSHTALKVNFAKNFHLQSKKAFSMNIYDKAKKMSEKINVYSLIQLLYFQQTFAEVLAIKQVHTNQLLKYKHRHSQLIGIYQSLAKKESIEVRKTPQQYRVPYMPNAPSY